MASPISSAGSRTSGTSPSGSITSLPSRYQPIPLQRPAASSTKSTSFYTDGTRHVCFVDFSGKSDVATDARQPLPARPRYTAEEEAWIIKFANDNPEKTWQHITDGFNIAFNQQRTLKGMQIKGYSLFDARGKNGALSMPTGLRQLRRRDEAEEEEEDDDDGGDEDEEEEEEDSDEEDSDQGNIIASVGKRYTRAQEDWLLAYVANTTKIGRRKDWVSTAAAFAAKFGLERAPMSLNNKWTHLSRQSSASILQKTSEQDAKEPGRGDEMRGKGQGQHYRRDDKIDYEEGGYTWEDGNEEQMQI